MNNYDAVKHLLLLVFMVIQSCNYSSKNVLEPIGSDCRLWWIYDARPTPGFICFNLKKYNSYTITWHGKLRKSFPGDVVDPLTEHGIWEIKEDSLLLQGRAYSKITIISDTVYIRPNVFLLDQTDKFNIENCDCDSLVAQFKGGNIDSIKTLLNYK
jgi:hypothetical protein